MDDADARYLGWYLRHGIGPFADSLRRAFRPLAQALTDVARSFNRIVKGYTPITAADDVLEIGVKRAIGFIKVGDLESAERALLVSGSYAEQVLDIPRDWEKVE